MNENFKNYYKINFAQALMPLPCTTTTRSRDNSPECCLLCMALRSKIAQPEVLEAKNQYENNDMRYFE